MEGMPKTSTVPVHGSHIRDLRRKRGWTRDELAHRVGIKGPHLSNIEGQRRPCSEHLAYRIVAALDVDPTEVIHSCADAPEGIA